MNNQFYVIYSYFIILIIFYPSSQEMHSREIKKRVLIDSKHDLAL